MRLLDKIQAAKHSAAVKAAETRSQILALDDNPEKALKKALSGRFIFKQNTGNNTKFFDAEDKFREVGFGHIEKWVSGLGWSVAINSNECRPVDAVLSNLCKNIGTENGFLSVFDTCFEPERGLLHEKNDWFYANTWSAVEERFEEVEPTPEEQTRWDDYLLFLAGGCEQKQEMIELWVANAVLFPRQRSVFALLLYGKSKGTGKGTLQSMMGKLVGDYVFKPEDPVKFVTGRFKNGIDEKTLIIFDEVYYDGHGFTNSLKQMISEERFFIEPKGKDIYEIDNHASVLATSNNEQPVWFDGTGDRRWLCINVEWNNKDGNGLHPDNAEQGQLIQNVWDWQSTDPQFERKLLWLLKRVDLTNYNRSIAPQTPELERLAKGSISIAEDAFKNAFNYGDALVVRRDKIFEGQRVAVSKQKQWLGEVGYVPIDSKIQINGEEARNWTITPLGVEKGLKPTMNGRQLTTLVLSHQIDERTPFESTAIH